MYQEFGGGFFVSTDNHKWRVAAIMSQLRHSNQQLRTLKGECLGFPLHKQSKLARVLNEGEGNLKWVGGEGDEYLLRLLGSTATAETDLPH